MVIAAAILLSIVCAIKSRWQLSPPTAAEEAAAAEAQGFALACLGVVDLFRALRFRLAGLRKCLDAVAHAGHRQLDLFVYDHAGDFSHRLGARRIYLRPSARAIAEARLSTFGLIELWVGSAALATIPLFERLPLIFVRLLHGFGDTFTVFLYLQIFLSALVMFIPTVLLGMTFPLVARLVHSKSVSRRQRCRQLLRGQHRRRGCRRFCRRLYFDPQPRRAKYHHFRRGPESFDRLLAGVSDRDFPLCRVMLWAWRCWCWRSSCRFKVHALGSAVLTSGVTIYNDRYESAAERFLARRGNEA